MTTSKVYLGKRKIRDLDAAIHSTAEAISEWETLRITTALGTKVHRTSRVVLKRPWWMPVRLYSRLLRSIVVEVQP